MECYNLTSYIDEIHEKANQLVRLLPQFLVNIRLRESSIRVRRRRGKLRRRSSATVPSSLILEYCRLAPHSLYDGSAHFSSWSTTARTWVSFGKLTQSKKLY
eukprot:SAG22_NODE_13173_length_416_cov_0.943218_1_plen_102_part_00